MQLAKQVKRRSRIYLKGLTIQKWNRGIIQPQQKKSVCFPRKAQTKRVRKTNVNKRGFEI
jgi:hypothetical protein